MSTSSAILIQEETAEYQDQDRLWKNIVTDMFEEFLLFFAPNLYEKVDWNKRPDSLEQEFHRLFPKRKGKRVSDKLLKVYLKDGQEQWILVHIEIQGKKEDDFPERMFQYFYRIFDAYKQRIFSIALFTDAHKSFKPNTFSYRFHGTNLTYEFNAHKLIDQNEKSLLESNNPFSLAILAGIYVVKTRNNANQRFQFKRQLYRLMIQEGSDMNRSDFDSLIYFIDFLLDVPEIMTNELEKEMDVEKALTGKEDTEMSEMLKMGPSPTIKAYIKRKMNEGKEEGKFEEKREMAAAMLKEGLEVKLIEKVTQLNIEEIEQIKNSL